MSVYVCVCVCESEKNIYIRVNESDTERERQRESFQNMKKSCNDSGFIPKPLRLLYSNVYRQGSACVCAC